MGSNAYENVQVQSHTFKFVKYVHAQVPYTVVLKYFKHIRYRVSIISTVYNHLHVIIGIIT